MTKSHILSEALGMKH